MPSSIPTEKKKQIILSIRRLFDKHPILKFSSVAVLIIIYFLFISRSYGIKDGILLSVMTWSFFVLSTPIADAGILIDFPMRMITGIKMVYSEMIVWAIAITLNTFVLFNNPSVYDKTGLLSLFKHIISNPFPYWLIIILSGIGTFLSVYIADSLTDSRKRKKKHINLLEKYKMIIFIFLILLILAIYRLLLIELGIQIPLI